ncbi:MAG: hypothetical protein QXN96_06360 [Candidatus Bathyarchaeia archaeon]
MTNKSFDDILLEAVDEALASLGESVKQSIYYHLEEKFRIPRKEIPNRVKEFAEGLEKIFGIGARFLEILIMRKLYDRIGKPIDWDENKEFAFANYVEAARRSFKKSQG